MDPSKVLNAWDGSQVDSSSHIPQGQCKLVVYRVKTPCTHTNCIIISLLYSKILHFQARKAKFQDDC
jgi:hypothetical protein